MPITQHRLISILNSWQALLDRVNDLKEDATLWLDQAEKTHDFENTLRSVVLAIHKLEIPNHELLTAEQVHFKHAKQRNNYSQRYQAKKRGKMGLGERYASDTILPARTHVTPPPQFAAAPPMPAPIQRAAPPRAEKIDPSFTEPITPPDPDTQAEAVKDVTSFEDLL